ncbi:MAG: penicillin-binding transpeptidase domain-containing protein, partial [Bacteroidota bacterium]
THRDSKIKTTIDVNLQKEALKTVDFHLEDLEGNHIHNCAVLITDVRTGEVLTYIGNRQRDANAYVDVIQSKRSTGSILKPLLYALSLEQSEILPNTLLPDIPSSFSGYRPANFHESFDGAVPAGESLVRSLNVPAVYLLQKHGVAKFLAECQELGFEQMNQSSEHYGLSLILGGAETNLWELNRCYGYLANQLHYFSEHNGEKDVSDYKLSLGPQHKASGINPQIRLKAGSIYNCFEQLRHLKRPSNELGWESFTSSKKVAWKTGTSFGHRDAWAVGITGDYVVSVWVGNDSGEGRNGLTGSTCAGPILFDLIDLLPNSEWFSPPFDDMNEVFFCEESGNLPGPDCLHLVKEWVPSNSKHGPSCEHHERHWLNPMTGLRVKRNCSSENMVHKTFFHLPPAQSLFYKSLHPEYEEIPPWSAECLSTEQTIPIALVFPTDISRISIPRDVTGELQSLVLKASHAQHDATLFWSLDNEYLGSTKEIHQVSIVPSLGTHVLTITD